MSVIPTPRRWSSLSEAERSELLIAYQPVADCEELTCSFDVKLKRMQTWLAGHGVTISEAEIRTPRIPMPKDERQ